MGGRSLRVLTVAFVQAAVWTQAMFCHAQYASVSVGDTNTTVFDTRTVASVSDDDRVFGDYASSQDVSAINSSRDSLTESVSCGAANCGSPACGDTWGPSCGPPCGSVCGGCGTQCYNSCTDCCYCQSCCACPQIYDHFTSGWGEFLYLQASGADMAHAQQQNGTGGAGTVPFGIIGTVDPDYSPAARIGFNWAIDRCSSIAGSYTYYESDAVQSTVPPAIGGGAGTVGSLVHHPAATIIGSNGPVQGFYDINYQMIDIDYRKLFRGCCDHWINWSVGARYGHLEQDFLQVGNFAGGAAGAINTATTIDFDGGGLKFGLDGEKLIGCHGFSGYGRAAVAPMIGQFRSRYRMRNTTTQVDLAIAEWNDDRFVTNLEYEFGLRWTNKSGRLRLAGGYMAQFWYNAITTPGLVDAVQANNYSDVGDTISFDGFVGRVEVVW